ncbi:uncharacterized protein KZ484_017437 isoform 2-T2 [Pholidichthys leucotaenia]
MDEHQTTPVLDCQQITQVSNSDDHGKYLSSSCQECHKIKQQHEQRLKQMEDFYQNKLDEQRAVLKQREKELRSIKDRLAADSAISLKTGTTERRNSPVSNSRLTEMYQHFKLLQWPKIKDQLKARKMKLDDVKAMIQNSFKKALADMKEKRKQIEDVISLIENGSELSPQKIKEYKQFAIQNYQLSQYKKKNEHQKAYKLESAAPYSEEVENILTSLLSECYWMSSLWALNNPPLQPNWDSVVPSMDRWAFFPQDLAEVK